MSLNHISKVSLTKIILPFVLLFFFNISFSQNKAEQIDQLVQTYTDYGKFNGSVLVSEQGKVIFKKGYGLANMEWDIPNQPNTKHRLGSITKQFTAMLILQLASVGKLDLHAPITTYLPDYPKSTGDIITTHHLLTHTSGIPNYTAFPRFFQDESRNPFTPDEFVKKFQDSVLDFTPGDKFSYSNSGYFLLGVLIEKISDKTYEEILHENIFTPLNMTDSGFDHHEDILKHRATGYEKRGSNYVNSDYLDMTIPYAAGSIYSTVEDLYLWDQALYTNKLLPKEYMELYFKPHTPAFGRQYAYGWGVGKQAIGTSTDSIYVIGHGGGINGFNTLISRIPEDNSLVVLLNNTGRAPLNAMTNAITAILYDKPFDRPKQSVANSLFAIIEKDGIEAGLAHYNNVKDADDYDLNEGEMNTMGYQLLQSGKVEEAAEVFRLNVEVFPESPNVYDSYAEALMYQGKNDLAIENYKKSVELNPGNQNGIDYLKKLGADVSEYEKVFEVADSILESYVGKYELRPGFILTVTKEGSQLKTQATGQPAFDIFPKSESTFYPKAFQAELHFNINDDGVVDSATLFQGGNEMLAKRVE
ncbi:serine hydrolase [Yeosuana sp. MJ-SS3]|uniref:Serine hydrolase n=1 Tax=Gilvirhabdus luticola TaxID=3079858 RepID=A0ABU3U7F2_9FLAO|nr:serine hydrolase [Yeosuana sp. MJ-SS3]MDU8886241.1 serine hydrolase [Yeosuana sp. MJ-SS3]